MPTRQDNAFATDSTSCTWFMKNSTSCVPKPCAAPLVLRARVCLGLVQEPDTSCGISSSGMAELALFQELHSYSTVCTGHSTLLVPLAVVTGTGTRFILWFTESNEKNVVEVTCSMCSPAWLCFRRGFACFVLCLSLRAQESFLHAVHGVCVPYSRSAKRFTLSTALSRVT